MAAAGATLSFSGSAVCLQRLVSSLLLLFKVLKILFNDSVASGQEKTERSWKGKSWRVTGSCQMSNMFLNPEKQQDEANTDTSNQIQHETSVWETLDLWLFKPTSCSSVCCWCVTGAHLSLFNMLPLHLFFSSFLPPLTSCGIRICWAAFPLTSWSRSHLNSRTTRQFIKTKVKTDNEVRGVSTCWGEPSRDGDNVFRKNITPTHGKQWKLGGCN